MSCQWVRPPPGRRPADALHAPPRAPPLPPQLVKDYVASGRLEKEVDFSADDKCLAAAKA